MDRPINIVTTSEWPKRHGKRKKIRVPIIEQHAVTRARSWASVATFLTVLTMLVTLAAGVGATNAGILSTELMGVGTCTSGSAGLLALSQGGMFANRECQPGGDRVRARQTQPPGIARALAAVESFSFDGRAAATAHELYEKDAHGGWIWGNSKQLSKEQRASLQAAVRARKTAFAYSMEELPGYSGAVGAFELELDTSKSVVQPPRRYSPAEQLIINCLLYTSDAADE